MTPFQWIVVPMVGLVAAWNVYRAIRAPVRRKVAWFSAVLWAVTGACVARPEVMGYAAQLLGIGRGADLVFYSFCLALLVLAIQAYNRIRQLDAALTAIVRHLALLGAVDNLPEPGTATDPERGPSKPDNTTYRAA
jgi:hypothetical protein